MEIMLSPQAARPGQIKAVRGSRIEEGMLGWTGADVTQSAEDSSRQLFGFKEEFTP